MTAAAPLAATAVVQKKAAAAAPADSATAGVVAMSVAAAPAPGHERWAVGPLLRFASPTLEAAFQEDRSRRQGAAEMCWSTLAGAPSVLWELMQRPPLHLTALGLAVLLLPLWAAWLRLRAPGRHALQQAALVVHMACWAAMWAASQQALAAAPARAAAAPSPAVAPRAAALPVLLLRLASQSWVPLLAVYPHLVGMSLPAAAAGQAAAAAAALVAAGAACKRALAACPADAELFVQAAGQLDAWAAAALPLGAPAPGGPPCSGGRCWDGASACGATTIFVHVAACGLLSLGAVYSAERRRRQEFAAQRGQWQAEGELRWRRLSAWHGVLHFALAACVLWLPLSAAWPRR